MKLDRFMVSVGGDSFYPLSVAAPGDSRWMGRKAKSTQCLVFEDLPLLGPRSIMRGGHF